MGYFILAVVAYCLGYLGGYNRGKRAIIDAGAKFFGMFKPPTDPPIDK